MAAERPALRHAGHLAERPLPRRAPGWMTWAPPAAIAWAIVYGSVRIWLAIGGAPSLAESETDLIAFSGWGAVGLCAAAAVVALALMMAPWRRPLFVAAWAVSAALLAASARLLLDVIGGLLPGLWITFRPVEFASHAAGAGGAVLMGAAAVAYRRRWRSSCLFCGRTGAPARPAQPPGWAWWAAYAAVAGCLVRLVAQLVVGLDGAQMQGGGSLLAFEAGFVLAGTVLPLALVHRWGRVVPRWVPLLAGRRVPRWLLLGPAFGIAGAMTAYFAVSTVKLVADTVNGTWDQDDSLPLAFFWVAVPAYLAWGLGLGAAALGYFRVTRPRCRVCGQ